MGSGVVQLLEKRCKFTFNEHFSFDHKVFLENIEACSNWISSDLLMILIFNA
ncbi:hypothetical protein [Nostoc sp. CHAB 5715]|uniref:hypothetical protein n=1 Tax=Nostoc sp. CHAB 5715 TaxID=2780400 RepID=UPI001E5B7087|nr:hypothetical protein [Nostoc sp. CHAB 5715]MCC5625066.1 hypothetical protein [Nostoc sp. CHAB 5715]